MKTQLVSAIHLQEVELQEQPADPQATRTSSSGESGGQPSIRCCCCCDNVINISDRLSADQTFTVEDAVETIGFGRFHILLFVIMGSANVSPRFLRSADAAVRC